MKVEEQYRMPRAIVTDNLLLTRRVSPFEVASSPMISTGVPPPMHRNPSSYLSVDNQYGLTVKVRSNNNSLLGEPNLHESTNFFRRYTPSNLNDSVPFNTQTFHSPSNNFSSAQVQQYTQNYAISQSQSMSQLNAQSHFQPILREVTSPHPYQPQRETQSLQWISEQGKLSQHDALSSRQNLAEKRETATQTNMRAIQPPTNPPSIVQKQSRLPAIEETQSISTLGKSQQMISSQTKAFEEQLNASQITKFEIDMPGIGKYRGQTINGRFNGLGELFDKDGSLLYRGWFVDNEFEGVGLLLNQEKEPNEADRIYYDLDKVQEAWEKFEGEFHHSKFNGVGHLFLLNRESFFGEFKAGKADGYGVYYLKNGAKLAGIWKYNKLVEKI